MNINLSKKLMMLLSVVSFTHASKNTKNIDKKVVVSKETIKTESVKTSTKNTGSGNSHGANATISDSEKSSISNVKSNNNTNKLVRKPLAEQVKEIVIISRNGVTIKESASLTNGSIDFHRSIRGLENTDVNNNMFILNSVALQYEMAVQSRPALINLVESKNILADPRIDTKILVRISLILALRLFNVKEMENLMTADEYAIYIKEFRGIIDLLTNGEKTSESYEVVVRFVKFHLPFILGKITLDGVAVSEEVCKELVNSEIFQRQLALIIFKLYQVIVGFSIASLLSSKDDVQLQEVLKSSDVDKNTPSAPSKKQNTTTETSNVSNSNDFDEALDI
jgi:hypothetical protein